MQSWTQIKQNFKPILYLVVVLWVIKSAETLFHFQLTFLSIYPQSIKGLSGILFAPLLHSSWEHLAANTLPLLFLGAALVYGYPKSKWPALLIIWISSGVGVWLLGRESYHLGASGVTHGLFYFLFLASILRRDKRSIALMMIAVFMYGTMLLGVLPWDSGISFEAHLFGAVGGIIAAIYYRNNDPKPPVKKYDWELEPEDEAEEPYWEVSRSQDANSDQRYHLH